MKILFLVPYPTEGASNRVRVEQFIPYMEERGIRCRVRPFVNQKFYAILYLPRRYMAKAFHFLICTLNRLLDIARALFYDVIFIHREAFPFGGPFIESALSWIGKPIVYDFDDAIFLSSTSKQNIHINRFKNPGKVSSIIQMARSVIVGNAYLRDFALQFNSNTVIIPSSVDTEVYGPSGASGRRDVTVGWIGSNTTEDFLYDLEDVFVRLSGRYDNIVFKIVGAEFRSAGLRNVVNKRWVLSEEVADLQSFDIGIMPMPDNLWTRGKCGFKAILYMACAIPVVVSPVGVNTEIVDDGVNGYLAGTKDGWVEKISSLVENEPLRRRMGQAGRQKVLDRYSLKANARAFYAVLNNLKVKP